MWEKSGKSASQILVPALSSLSLAATRVLPTTPPPLCFLLLISQPVLSFKNSNIFPYLCSPLSSLLAALRQFNPTISDSHLPLSCCSRFHSHPHRCGTWGWPTTLFFPSSQLLSRLESVSHICLLFHDHFWQDLRNCSSWLVSPFQPISLTGQINTPEMHPWCHILWLNIIFWITFSFLLLDS